MMRKDLSEWWWERTCLDDDGVLDHEPVRWALHRLLEVHPQFSRFACIKVYLFIHLFVSITTQPVYLLSVCHSIVCLFISQFVCMSTFCLFICLFACKLLIYLSASLVFGIGIFICLFACVLSFFVSFYLPFCYLHICLPFCSMYFYLSSSVSVICIFSAYLPACRLYFLSLYMLVCYLSIFFSVICIFICLFAGLLCVFLSV